MEKNVFIEDKKILNNINTTLNISNTTNDIIVNDFINQKISLETLIENKLLKTNS